MVVEDDWNAIKCKVANGEHVVMRDARTAVEDNERAEAIWGGEGAEDFEVLIFVRRGSLNKGGLSEGKGGSEEAVRLCSGW